MKRVGMLGSGFASDHLISLAGALIAAIVGAAGPLCLWLLASQPWKSNAPVNIQQQSNQLSSPQYSAPGASPGTVTLLNGQLKS